MIGIFDSGIGGLTVARAVMKSLPDCPVCYLGDTARTPYGNKSPETVTRYAIEDTRFLLEHGALVVVVACNSASSAAYHALRETFDIPLFEVITPAVETALALSKVQRVGVIGTRATVASGIYERMILERDSEKSVYSQACPLLVPLVEEGWMNRPETRMIVKKYIHPLKVRQVDTLILGCTHYPLLKDVIQAKIGKRVRVIDSSHAVASSLVRYLEEHPDLHEKLRGGGPSCLYVTDVTEQFRTIAGRILEKNVSLTHVEI